MQNQHKNHTVDILNCLANLSSDEIFTPPEIVNQMLDMLPQAVFQSTETTFLDPCTKSGVFLRELTYPVASHGGSHARDPGWKMLVFHTEVFRVVLTDKPLWDRYLLRSQLSKPLTGQLRADRYFTGFNSFSVSRTGR